MVFPFFFQFSFDMIMNEIQGKRGENERKGRGGRACVVVLGDLGRSPRMQYHALSLARQVFFPFLDFWFQLNICRVCLISILCASSISLII